MVKEIDLYRIFKVDKGDYKGEYRLYFNRKVAEYYLPDRKIYKWGDDECLQAEAGDYIESYDGSVVMLIRKRVYTSKKTQVPFYFFRFPMSTITAYVTKTKGIKFREFYGQMAYINKGEIVPKIRQGSDNQKIRFVSMLLSGVHPFKAYRIAFGKFDPIEIGNLHRKVNKLMTDEVVRTEINEQLVPFIEQLNEEFSDNKIVQQLKLLIDNSRKGSDAHRENIKFIMALLNKLPQAMYSGSKAQKSLAQEVQVISPPQLGQIEQ